MARKILLIEDSEPDRELLRIALGRVDDAPELDEAVTGEAGLAHLRAVLGGDAELPALVLLDINLPGLNGHEVLEEIRQLAGCEGLPVVMLTTSSDPLEVRSAYEHGANAYLVKPASMKRQVEMLADLKRFFFDQASLPYEAA
ncbi:MAG: response regulator [Myxococcota bacterium]